MNTGHDAKRIFLGVDGGGSKTAALAIDETGHVVGVGFSGEANYHTSGIDNAMRSVREAVQGALDGLSAERASFCMAAADMPQDFLNLENGISALHIIDCPFTVHNDVISIVRAGSRFPYGVGVVCGTGFNAGGIGKNGEEERFLALGDVTGDRAGGSELSMAAVGAAFRAWDGRGEATMLAEAIPDAIGVKDLYTLAEQWAQRKIDVKALRGLSPLVFEIAVEGDAVAQSLIRAQGEELGIAANVILRKLDLVEEDCDVVLGGSVFNGRGTLLIDTIREAVQQINTAATVKRLDIPPVVGAALIAVDKSGIRVDRSFHTNLRTSLPEVFEFPQHEY
jgi:N-acetylglucosamine kinase-like BadF-type ATPase